MGRKEASLALMLEPRDEPYSVVLICQSKPMTFPSYAFAAFSTHEFGAVFQAKGFKFL